MSIEFIVIFGALEVVLVPLTFAAGVFFGGEFFKYRTRLAEIKHEQYMTVMQGKVVT